MSKAGVKIGNLKRFGVGPSYSYGHDYARSCMIVVVINSTSESSILPLFLDHWCVKCYRLAFIDATSDPKNFLAICRLCSSTGALA